MYDPTDEQRVIINGDASALVVAGPGRGKTATAVAAARSWLARNPGASRVLFTSFSNAAVKRIAAGAGIDPAGLERRVQFRTIHSLAMEILRDFGRFVGLRRPARALDRTEEGIIAAERGWEAEDETGYRTALKALAREEGRVAFELMVPLALALLAASPTVRLAVGRRFPFIVVDELQDTRVEQWEFLKLVGGGEPGARAWRSRPDDLRTPAPCRHSTERRKVNDLKVDGHLANDSLHSALDYVPPADYK